MKKILLIAAATMTLAACNNEDSYVDEPVEVRFSATIGGSAMTRASETSWDAADQIGIFMGDDRYVNFKYETENGDGNFSGTTLYFKNKQEQLKLSAYYPFTGEEGSSPGSIEFSTEGNFQTPVKQREIDYMYAFKENVAGTEPNINLTFNHKMSKLTFVFENGNDGTDVGKITSYQVDGLKLKGTFNPLSGVCAPQEGASSESLSISFQEGEVKDGVATPSLIILPQEIGGNTVTLKISDSEQQNYYCKLNFGNEGILPGNSYKFKIVVNKTSLIVKAGISEWVENDEEEFKAESSE